MIIMILLYIVYVSVSCSCPFPQSPINYVHHHRSNHFYYRNEIISHLDTNYHLLSHICQNMENYIRKVRQVLESKSK